MLQQSLRPRPAPRRVSYVGALLSLLVALLSLGTAAHAADNGAWSVSPTPPEGATAPRNYFVLEGDPGTTIKDKVRIQNWTKKPLTLNIYAADAYNTADDGFFAVKELGATMAGVGAWVKPLISQVTIDGRTQTDIPVTIRIPRNATPGDHAGGIVALNTKVERSNQATEGMDIGIQRAVAARVYVRVSGTSKPGLEVSGVTVAHDRGAWPWSGDGEATVTWTVTNNGNTRLAPDARVTLRGLLGEQGSVAREQVLDLLPGQSVRLTEEVSGVPWIGRTTATVRLDAGEGLVSSDSASQWVLPWPFLLTLTLLLAVAGTWLWRRAARMRRRLAEAEEAPRIRVRAGV